VKSFFTITVTITHHPWLFPISPFFSNSIDPVVVLTLLLHKDPVELTGYHHEKSVSNILMISSKRNHLFNPADDIDLRVIP
jgi:hypothetical protein